VTDISDLTRPDDAGSPEAGQWVSALGGLGEDGPWPAFVPMEVPLAASAPPGLVEDELGWSVLDVERFVSWSTGPDETTSVVVGAVDDGRLMASPSTPVVRDWQAGAEPSLADDRVCRG
jgi:hypothetical protein